jgi:pyrophosphatase PpaX
MRAIVFDLDGTLLDVQESIYRQYEMLTAEYNGAAASRAAIDEALLSGPDEATRQLVTNTRVPFEQIKLRREQLRSYSLDYLQLYPGVYDLLPILQNLGIKIAVLATDSTDTVAHIDRLGLGWYADVVVTPEQVMRHKPHPEAVQQALYSLQVLPQDTVVVGDTIADMVAAQNAHVRAAIGITHGDGDLKELQAAGADRIVGDMPSVLDVLG